MYRFRLGVVITASLVLASVSEAQNYKLFFGQTFRVPASAPFLKTVNTGNVGILSIRRTSHSGGSSTCTSTTPAIIH